MKKVIFFGLVWLCFAAETFAASSTILSYPTLYRGPRALAMGDAYTAVGRDAEAVFYNPAGLHSMPFNISVNVGLEADQNVFDLYQDISDTMGSGSSDDTTTQVMDLLERNQGKTVHGRLASFPRVAWKSFLVGGFAQGMLDAKLHNPLSSQGAMEITSINGLGGVVGGSLNIKQVNGLRIGASMKQMYFATIQTNLGVDTLAGGGDSLLEDATIKTDMGFDIGALYDIKKGKLGKWDAQVGASFMNITGYQYSADESIPMVMNLGISIRPKLTKYTGKTLFAFDIQDVLFAHSQDGSLWKRIHMGAEQSFLGDHLQFRAGLNQGYLSAGIGLDIWIAKAAFTYYTEEMGAYAGQDPDQRYLGELTLGW